jgi:hypothetical protein
VVATDLPNVIDSVLGQNVGDNIHLVAGSIQVRELDWMVEPDQWSWTDAKSVSCLSPRTPADDPVGPPST